jgi:hypothetical protein
VLKAVDRATGNISRKTRRSGWHTGGSYGGLRLVGVDGTTFNVANTPSLKSTAEKTKIRRGEAAFFRISCVALAALGSHRPLAVRVGRTANPKARSSKASSARLPRTTYSLRIAIMAAARGLPGWRRFRPSRFSLARPEAIRRAAGQDSGRRLKVGPRERSRSQIAHFGPEDSNSTSIPVSS